MKTRNIILKNIRLPTFKCLEEMPDIPVAEFEKRITLTLDAMHKRQIDVLCVFADREHFANFRFLTNLDPRFEEALLLIHKNGKRKILFGNECMNWGGVPPIPFDFELFQDFSLLGQNRAKSRSLETILKDFGIKKLVRIGCAYYKYFINADGTLIPQKLDIPAYLADVLVGLTGSKNMVANANNIFMDAATGLRHHNCLEELVRFEWASVRTSESIWRMIQKIAPGKREYDLSANYFNNGLPYSCHPMLSTGEKVKYGLSSPSANKVALGHPFTAAFGLTGGLTCRAGMVAQGPEHLSKKVAAFYEKFWRNYFKTVVAWYENIGIGVSAGAVAKKVEEARENSLFDFALNTGHSIHLDEWVNSPFYAGSDIKLYSGLALQMDIIPTNTEEFVAANAEDGIVLADEELRKDWQKRFPDSWKRIMQRRDFMINKLGIKIKPEVLPLSNIPAYYPPHLLNCENVAVVE